MSEITFVIPSINRPTLDVTINSVLKQTLDRWRCIIVYDGVEGKEFHDERISTIKIDKTGAFDKHGTSGLVRNFGIKMCETDWIGFIDDDDSINEKYVETLFSKYDNFDFIIWKMQYLDGNIIPNSTNLFEGNVGISFSFKKNLNVIFKSNRNGEDFDFLNELLTKTNNFTITEEVFYMVNY
jgi:glycosyltransferase involved in cell wall biosynthesis